MRAENIFSLISAGIISHNYTEKETISSLSKLFDKQGYVTMPSLFKADITDLLKEEVEKLNPIKDYRCFNMPGYETPRNLYVVGGQKIMASSGILPLLYSHSDVRSLIELIIGHTVFPIRNVHEYMVINRLEGPGQTHGWHLDDPRYALIVILESSDDDPGGCLEYVKDWPGICEREGINFDAPISQGLLDQVARDNIFTYKFKKGDCYLLDAANCLHRVTPLRNEGSRRVALNLAYHDTQEVVYGKTAETLYGVETL